MELRPASPEELDATTRFVDEWLAQAWRDGGAIVDVTRDEEIERRWYVRIAGEERDFTTLWFTLGQRSLRYESYVLPAPEEHHREVYELVLRLNHQLVGVQFSIGPEDAIFLTGRLPISLVDAGHLDRIIGTVFETVERYFRPLLALGFASRLGR